MNINIIYGKGPVHLVSAATILAKQEPVRKKAARTFNLKTNDLGSNNKSKSQ